jgi:hypothetical protein
MRRTRTIRALIRATVVVEGMAALNPRGRVSIRVAFSENALVAALNQAKSTSAADTPVRFWGLQNAHLIGIRHRLTAP